ncbi:hypothetical protein OEZ85_011515 [Tetradesmus obliquus]|uniref:Uncharacterized protein n=1 Tax=Tetradesmus obliquus TaxID=3088 RepID=A0ABY8TQU7_TETOB|nr:hypothetical protein OEZ85_011515 [Tetradesmus obliquus]
MLRAAEGLPRDELLLRLLRELRQGSVGVGQVVVSLSNMPAGRALLRPHIKVLLELVAVQAPCQALVAKALLQVAGAVPVTEETLATLAALDPQPLLQAALQGDRAAVWSMGTIACLALTNAGRQSLLPHISTILSLVAPQADSVLCRLAMHAIRVLSEPAAPEWAQQALLQHSSGLLAAMSQTAHPDTAVAAGEVLLSLAGTPAGPVQLRQHIKVLLEMVAEPAPCQRHAALVLQVVTSNDDEAMAELAELDLQPLLQAVMQGGVVAEPAAAILQMLAPFDAGRRALMPHIPTILSLVAPQTSPLVCHTMMGLISVFCGAGSPEWAQQAVLQHSSGLLAAMAQAAHPGPAVAAGEVLLSLIETPDRLHALSSEQHVDALVGIVQSRAPAMTLAAKALAQLACEMPAVLPLLAAPGRTEAMNSMLDIQQELLGCAADSPRAKQLLELVHWLCVVSAACKGIPTFLPGLIRCLQRPALTLALFAELEALAVHKIGQASLAPYIRHVRQAVAAPQFLAYASLQARLSSMEAAVQAAARQYQRFLAALKAHQHHAVTLLARQHLHMQQPWTAAEQESVVQSWQRVANRQRHLEVSGRWLAAVAQVNTD